VNESGGDSEAGAIYARRRSTGRGLAQFIRGAVFLLHAVWVVKRKTSLTLVPFFSRFQLSLN